MTLFQYQALDEDGRMHAGRIEAASSDAVREEIRRSGLTLLEARQTVQGGRDWRAMLTPEPPPADITRFTQDLAMLLRGGVSLDQALAVIAQMESRRWLVALTRELNEALAAGKSFSAVLAEHPRYFPPIYVKTVQASEAAGRLQQALASLAVERQRVEALRRRLFGAMAYPGFLAIAAVGVMVFVLLYIVPQFEGAIAGFRDRIAPSSLVVFELSETLRNNLDLAGGLLIALMVALLVAKRFAGRNSLGLAIASRLPFLSRIVSFNLTLTFCRTLAMLIRNGVDISTALGLIRDIVTTPGAAAKLEAVTADVRGGMRLSNALATSALLPSHVVQMLRVGESAGDLAASADRIAEFYEMKLDGALGQLTAVIGPVLMMLVSVIVGWLIISIMGALMSINDLLI